MNIVYNYISAFIFLTSAAVSYEAQILAIVPIYGQSHWNVMDAVLQTLVSAGHNLTVFTPFVKKEKITNYTQIDTSSYLKHSASAPFECVDGFNGVEYLIKTHQETCVALYENEKFWTVLESNKYELFVTQLLGSGCDSYIAHYLRVPMIAVTSSALPTSSMTSGNPLVTSCTSTLYAPMALPKTFADRLSNSYDYVYTNVQSWWYDRDATAIGRAYFGERAPDAHTLKKRIALMFVNSHFTFHLSAPWAPNLIEIGGIHVTDPKPLPEDIQQFIDGAPDGVIYFSFGSTVKMDTLPDRMQNALREAFAELPQRILWKFDGDTMENQPENVMIKKWFPQRDILAHPKLKLFVYHGGMSGMNEAIVSQVPILGIPIFSDQHRNVANAVHLGMGLSLDYRTLDKMSILAAAKEIISNAKYRQNVQTLNKIFKDRPMSPRSLVAYWTQYVINHNGTKHMQSETSEIFWVYYYLLDILLFVLLISISPLFYCA